MYRNCLHSVSGGLMALGDALAQTFVEKRDLSQYDLLRTGRFLVFGTFLGVRFTQPFPNLKL